ILLVKANELIHIVGFADSQAFLSAANDIFCLVAEASPQLISRTIAIEKKGRMSSDLATGSEKRGQVTKVGAQRHFHVVVIGQLPKHLGEKRVGRSDARLGLAGRGQNTRSQEARNLRHLAYC